MTKTLSSPLAQAGPGYRGMWALLWPARLYLRHFPIQRGKGLLLRHLLMKSLPAAPAEFETAVAGGARIRLLYRETIGWSSLVYGPFEEAELHYLMRLVKPGDVVFDIGANVGLFSVVLGRAVGATGRVIAAEPVPANALRAKENIELNGLVNVQLVREAIGADTRVVCLNLADDAAYPSLGEVAEARGTGVNIEVPQRRLDDLWREIGSPPIRVVKVDVEGAELDVLRGAAQMLRTTRPLLLLEANDKDALEGLREFLTPIGYEFSQPSRFMVNNYIASVQAP